MSNDLRVSDRAVEFDEFKVSDHVHPHAQPTPDFDWHGLALALGEEIHETDQQRLAHALGAFVRWLADPLARCCEPQSRLSPRRAERTVARTALVVAWIIAPAMFNNMTVEALADALDLNERHIRKIIAKARCRFGELRRLQ